MTNFVFLPGLFFAFLSDSSDRLRYVHELVMWHVYPHLKQAIFEDAERGCGCGGIGGGVVGL